MNIGDISIFCNLPPSLSSIVCSSPCRGHLHPSLSLLLGIWFFEASVNGIVFLHCFSNCSLLLNRKAANFCKLNFFVSFYITEAVYGVYKFWGRVFSSLWYRIMSFGNRKILNASLPIYILFISSSCLIALGSNSRNMLNKSGESTHPCLVPDFRGNGFCLFPLRMMLAIGFFFHI
jgi:hypothetical protein